MKIDLPKFFLIQVMMEFGVKKIVFSSSATVYGDPEYLPVDEKHPTGKCTNPYGKTKYFMEEIIKDQCTANHVIRENYVIKVSFFWDQSKDIYEFKWFPAKKTGLWFADLSGLLIRGLLFGRKPLELMSWLGSQKKLTLVILYVT